MNIAVLGAGNGGQAAAADLTLRGHRVRLYDRFPEVIEPLAVSGQIKLVGAIVGTAKLDDVTTDIGRAVTGAEVILITVPGFALSWLAAELAASLVDGQIVILHPGGTGGALEVRQAWRDVSLEADVTLAETDTLLYACRAVTPGEVDVKAVKRELWVAALPAEDTPVAMDALAQLFSQATPARNVLATSLSNMNAVIHPAVALMSATRIDSHDPSFEFYRDGITLSVGTVLEAVDAERCALARALDTDFLSCQDWIEARYGVVADDAPTRFELLARDIYQGIGTPESMQARYVSEDVPMALVPMEQLAELVDVATPTISALISLCSSINGVDYRASGRTLARLGISNVGADGITRELGALVGAASD
jgi:opine dehydrogenase